MRVETAIAEASEELSSCGVMERDDVDLVEIERFVRRRVDPVKMEPPSATTLAAFDDPGPDQVCTCGPDAFC
jgi:hypothetical protein